jgi:hypothetical protein
MMDAFSAVVVAASATMVCAAFIVVKQMLRR